MRTLLYSALAALLLPLSLSALDGDWQFLNSASDVRDIAYYNGSVYCATSGGFLIVNTATGARTVYTLSNGLGGTGVTTVAVDGENGKVYLGLDNRNITVYDRGALRTYTDFKSQGSCVFNKFLVHEGTLLIATNEGLGFFAEDDGGIVYPFLTMFGDSTNPFLYRSSDIRDLAVTGDTLYLLTRFFWARIRLDWQKPLLAHNPALSQGIPSIWTTNAAQGDFAVRVDNGDGTFDTTGFSNFTVTPDSVLGLFDIETYAGPQGAQFSLNMKYDALSRPSAVFITCHSAGASGLFQAGDTSSFRLPYPNFVKYPCMAADEQGRLYAGTSGRGVYRLADGVSFWNGDDQVLSEFKVLRTDSHGNVYALNIDNAGWAFQNSANSMGIQKYSASGRWIHLYTSYNPNLVHPGMNDIFVDTRDRLFGSIAEVESDRFWSDSSNGVIIFDNPYLDAPVAVDSTVINPSEEVNTQIVHSGVFVSHQPSAIHIDRKGNLYVGQSYCPPDRSPCFGLILIYADYSWVASVQAGTTFLNVTNYTGNPPYSGFKEIGRLDDHDQAVEFGRVGSISTDYAGNVWSVRSYSFGDVDVFGLLRSTADTLIFDHKSRIKDFMVDPDWLYQKQKGVAECRRGVDCYLAAKIVQKVKTDLYGNMWIGTSSGLYYYSEGRDTLGYGNIFGLWRYYLPDITVNDFDFDSLNNVWIATEGSGLKMLHYSSAKYPTDDREYGTGDPTKAVFTSFGKSTGLISESPRSVSVHRKSGKVFVGLMNGLQVYESGIRSVSDISKGYVYPVLIRGNGGLVLNTMQNGSTVSVFSLGGKLLFHKILPAYQSSVAWDSRNPVSREAIATGVYLYRFTSPDRKTKSGKFAVVR